MITHLFIVGTKMCMFIETLILRNSCCLFAHVAYTVVVRAFELLIHSILFPNKCRTTAEVFIVFIVHLYWIGSVN